MIDQVFMNTGKLYQEWARSMANMVYGQWLMMDAGMRAAGQLLEGPANTSPGGKEPAFPYPGKGDKGYLAELAAERATRGLPPPKEIYDVAYREQIDWSLFPNWARPCDPEVFEGCAHEG